MTCGNGQKVVWQAHDKCVAKKYGAAFFATNRGQNNNSKGGEGSVGNKGGWDTRDSRSNNDDGEGDDEGDDDGDGKEIRDDGDKRCGKARGHVTVCLMFKFRKS